MHTVLRGHLLSATKNQLFDIMFIESQLSSQFDGGQSDPKPETLVCEAEWGKPEQPGGLLKRYQTHISSLIIGIHHGPSMMRYKTIDCATRPA
jgi:hypothetical protein